MPPSDDAPAGDAGLGPRVGLGQGRAPPHGRPEPRGPPPWSMRSRMWSMRSRMRRVKATARHGLRPTSAASLAPTRRSPRVTAEQSKGGASPLRSPRPLRVHSAALGESGHDVSLRDGSSRDPPEAEPAVVWSSTRGSVDRESPGRSRLLLPGVSRRRAFGEDCEERSPPMRRLTFDDRLFGHELGRVVARWSCSGPARTHNDGRLAACIPKRRPFPVQTPGQPGERADVIVVELGTVAGEFDLGHGATPFEPRAQERSPNSPSTTR